jgi:hypothetical protein
MASNVLLWVRRGDGDSEDAQQFLRRHGYAADQTFDIDADPPGPEMRARLVAGLGGDASLLQDPKQPSRLRAPLLLTPRGALVGFRERRWQGFLDIGLSRS